MKSLVIVLLLAASALSQQPMTAMPQPGDADDTPAMDPGPLNAVGRSLHARGIEWQTKIAPPHDIYLCFVDESGVHRADPTWVIRDTDPLYPYDKSKGPTPVYVNARAPFDAKFMKRNPSLALVRIVSREALDESRKSPAPKDVPTPAPRPTRESELAQLRAEIKRLLARIDELEKK